eukprot:9489831-Pyramimonas_sp.AAC.1
MSCDTSKRSETYALAQLCCAVTISRTSRSWASLHVSLPCIHSWSLPAPKRAPVPAPSGRVSTLVGPTSAHIIPVVPP